ncbi:MAG: hypothetical protein MUF53_04695, partial [Gemmatimonadaceae bacterium]|nr:hypothetical protein [Gemmatimonadaceae bacterium]
MRPLVCGLGLVAAACGGGADRPPTNDTTGVAASAPGTPGPAPAAPVAWPPALGGWLVVGAPSGAARSGVLLVPDSVPDFDALAAVRGAQVELFGAGGRVGRASIAAVERADSVECIAWPMARLQLPPDSATTAWTLGVRAGSATPLPSVDFAGMGTRDSARLVVELARLASGLAGDTTPSFRGLPMVVRSAVRLGEVAGREVVVAEIVRRVGQEATPLEERIAMLAERDTGAGSPWRAGWVARIAGVEETIEASDFVGAVLVTPDTPVVVLQRESTKGARYEL